jgi:beta-phosphoglucomutase-like phosphatase (HAD superfamily)
MYDNIKTVIFDMDGVLFDSESLDKKVWIDLAEQYGVTDILEAFAECIGTPDSNIISVLDRYIELSKEQGTLKETHVTDIVTGERLLLNGAEFRRQSLVVFDKFVEEQGMPLKYYASECLADLKNKGYKLGLASSTPIDRVRPQLTGTGLIGYFDDIIGGGMFKKGKPDPEIFLMSCERLGGKPQESIVIEDSYNGIRAAYSAGMRSVMVPDIIMPDDEMRAKAWKILHDLKQVSELL